MALVQGSVGGLRSLVSTIKQYGDLPELQGFNITLPSNADTHKIFGHLINKIKSQVSSLQNSQALITEIYNSRKTEVNFVFAFSCILVIIVVIVLGYVLGKEWKDEEVCEDAEFHGAQVKRMDEECIKKIGKREKEIKDEKAQIAEQLLTMMKEYNSTMDKENPAQHQGETGAAESNNTIRIEYYVAKFKMLLLEIYHGDVKDNEDIVNVFTNNHRNKHVDKLVDLIKHFSREKKVKSEYTKEKVTITFADTNLTVNFAPDKINPPPGGEVAHINGSFGGLNQTQGDGVDNGDFTDILKKVFTKDGAIYKYTLEETLVALKTKVRKLKTETSEAELKELRKTAPTGQAHIAIAKFEIDDFVEFRHSNKQCKKILWIFTTLMAMIYLLVVSIKWFIKQRENAKATLDVNVVNELNNKHVRAIIDVTTMCHTSPNLEPDEIMKSNDVEKKKAVLAKLKQYVGHLKDIYDNYDALVDSLDRVDNMDMMRSFDKSATVIDKFMNKEGDDEEGMGNMENKEKQSVVRSEVIPAFALGFTKVRGLYHVSNAPHVVTKDAPPLANRVCVETLFNNVTPSDMLKEIQRAQMRAIDKIRTLAKSKSHTLVFVCVTIAPTSITAGTASTASTASTANTANTANTVNTVNTDHAVNKDIKMVSLFMDKIKDYSTAEFTPMRTFKVAVKQKTSDESETFTSPANEVSFTWMSNDVLKRSNITLLADACSTTGATGAAKCTYHLNLFDEQESVTTTSAAPLLPLVSRDQPLAFLESLTWFQGSIRDKVYEVMVKYKFKVPLLDYTNDILTALHDTSMSALVENEVKECYINILNDIDAKTQEAKKTLVAEEAYITFERFKVKFAELNSHDVCRDFAYNLLLMHVYGKALRDHYTDHNRYFSDQTMYIDFLRILIIFVLIVAIAWYAIFAYRSVWEFNHRQSLRKINFLLNMETPAEKNSDDGANGGVVKSNIPTLRQETSTEYAKEIIIVFGVKMLVLLAGLLMGWSLLYANFKKSENIQRYNQNMIGINTTRIIEGIDNALYYLSKPNNNNENVNTFGVHPLNTLLAASGAGSSSPLMTTDALRVVDRLIKNNAASMTAPVKLGADDRELRRVYEALVDMLISYKNGNSILMARNMRAVFPYVDIVTNGALLIGAVVLLLYLYTTMNPWDIVERAREFNIAIKEKNLDIIQCMLDGETRFYEINNIVILVCIVVIVIFFVFMNITKVLSSGSNYGLFLFNSPLYDNRMTYNMQF